MSRDAKHEALAYLNERESIACPLCGCATFSIAADTTERTGLRVRVVLCDHCGHLFLNPRPTADAYRRFYLHADYRAQTTHTTAPQQARLKQIQDPIYHERRVSHGYRLYDTYLDDTLGPDDLVFDFGCGDGAWLAGLRERCGCRIAGNEADQFCVDYIRDSLGIEIELGLIEELTDRLRERYTGSVSLAIISGSMQHMLDPMACLRLAHDLLKDGGRIYVCNKNLFQQELFLHHLELADYVSIDHPHYFHRSTYEFMMQASGFRVAAYCGDSRVRNKTMEILAVKSAVPPTPPAPARSAATIRQALNHASRTRWMRWLPRTLTHRFCKPSTKWSDY